MEQLRQIVFGLCLLVSANGSALAVDAPSPSAATASVVIDTAVHFQTADGSDTVLGSGRYTVESNAGQGLRVSSANGTSISLPATTATHDEKLVAPRASIVSVGEDERHLVLLLPDGEQLQAIGSLSGVRSRGVARPSASLTMAPAPAPIIQAPIIQAPIAPVQAPIAAPLGAPRNPIYPAAGPAPTGVVLTATPLLAQLSWNAMPGTQRYAVWRGDGANVSAERTPAGFTGTQFQDVVPDPRVTYRYAIIAYYPNGTSGEADVQFVSPPPINPPGFSARDQGQGQVYFQWQAVPGVVQYRLDGPGMAGTGYFAPPPAGAYAGAPTFAIVPNIPAGPDSWRLVALYPGNYGNFPGGSIASTVVRVLPGHSQPWLTKPNGPGLPYQVETPAHQEFNDALGAGATGNSSGDLSPVYDPAYVAWLGRPYTWSAGYAVGPRGPAVDPAALYAFRPDAGVAVATTGGGWSPPVQPSPACSTTDDIRSGCARPGLKIWLDTNSLLWDEPGQAANEAVYGNARDLGVGRRAYCEQRMQGPPVPGIYTVCYATAHGPTAVQAGFNDPQTITHPGEGVGSDFILSMVITKDPSGTAFLAFSGSGKYSLKPTVQLDTEAPKLVPFACLSCHGGTYNAVTRKVDGASFLPLDPELLAFASPADQAMQEEKIRRINQMIYNSAPTSAIGAYILGLYNGGLGQPGATATPDYVPAGWAAQAGLYRQIVRPDCALCHLAMPGGPNSYNFASWGNFQGNGPLIHASVCGAHTMPHNELQFKAFWTKDTGVLYLPGLLAATLGFQSC
jgi:hypothetical protein